MLPLHKAIRELKIGRSKEEQTYLEKLANHIESQGLTDFLVDHGGHWKDELKCPFCNSSVHVNEFGWQCLGCDAGGHEGEPLDTLDDAIEHNRPYKP